MSTVAKPRTADEVGDLAEDLLKRVIEPTLPPADAGRFICVDIASGAYEIDDDDMAAVDRLLARMPGAESYLAAWASPRPTVWACNEDRWERRRPTATGGHLSGPRAGRYHSFRVGHR